MQVEHAYARHESTPSTKLSADYQVSRVIDGDTFVVTKGRIKLTIR